MVVAAPIAPLPAGKGPIGCVPPKPLVQRQRSSPRDSLPMAVRQADNQNGHAGKQPGVVTPRPAVYERIAAKANSPSNAGKVPGVIHRVFGGFEQRSNSAPAVGHRCDTMQEPAPEPTECQRGSPLGVTPLARKARAQMAQQPQQQVLPQGRGYAMRRVSSAGPRGQSDQGMGITALLEVASAAVAEAKEARALAAQRRNPSQQPSSQSPKAAGAAQLSPGAGRPPSGATPNLRRQNSGGVERRVSNGADVQRAPAHASPQQVSADVRRRVQSPRCQGQYAVPSEYRSSTPPASRVSPRMVPTPAAPSPRRQPSGAPTAGVTREVSRGSPVEQRQHQNSPLRSARANGEGANAGTPRLQRQSSSQVAAATSSAAPAAGGKSLAGIRASAAVLGRMEDILKPRVETNEAKKERGHQPSYPGENEDFSMDEVVLEEAIGAGSFGAVWRGKFKGQTVAVKKCKVIDANDADMLLLEIRYLRKLRHPRLVSYYGFCNSPPNLVMMMEFMTGGSLHALIFKKKQQLELERRAMMSQQVAEGLSYLHEHRIVHRDLKTMNVVLDGELNCKICDFGLSFTLERTHLTVKALEGSPRYMAPEQFESKARITEKVDIWQMGCVMLELFCSITPFAAAQGVQQVATDLLIRKRGPAIPNDADPRARALIQACLRIDPKRRPAAPALEEALCMMRRDCGVEV
eukprot:CAMPEP_0178423996 /NCGR_PEP_ID=MMETSP0689_2-20121128/27981_1 /TAXON_ID=160604 /ORGANISM="Amphidinium massartii, Strain CS-259" /LENGTH=690 /DNA_ID=CAMNT_0020045617 /DNA_START=79 /DNA_END=2151 /DNA_ORIENTATION=+